MSHFNRDFETPSDNEITEDQLLDAEDMFLTYVHEMGEIPNSLEDEEFETFTKEEVFIDAQLKALAQIIKDDTAFDLDFKEFKANYLALAWDIQTKKVFGAGKDMKSFIDSLPSVLENMDKDFPFLGKGVA